TVFSQITNLFPKKIHAVTFEGFLIKIFLFVLGFTMDKAFC
ncbi:MAG TPA: IS982 family transposase, partial [Thermodesulfobacteriota bacterium]|nr:IS982 family transposase [Thermodesulfobacteriota bacterium]